MRLYYMVKVNSDRHVVSEPMTPINEQPKVTETFQSTLNQSIANFCLCLLKALKFPLLKLKNQILILLGLKDSKITSVFQDIHTKKPEMTKEMLEQATKNYHDADQAVIFVQKKNLHNLVQLNLFYVSQMKTFYEEHKNTFLTEEIGSTLNNYHTLFNNEFEHNNELQKTTDYSSFAARIFSLAKHLRDNLASHYKGMGPSEEKEDFLRLVTAYVTKNNDQHGIFKTPSSDVYLQNLQRNRAEAWNKLHSYK